MPDNQSTPNPTWTEAEHAEVMRLHIIEGYTVSHAMWVVFHQREEGSADAE